MVMEIVRKLEDKLVQRIGALFFYRVDIIIKIWRDGYIL